MTVNTDDSGSIPFFSSKLIALQCRLLAAVLVGVCTWEGQVGFTIIKDSQSWWTSLWHGDYQLNAESPNSFPCAALQNANMVSLTGKQTRLGVHGDCSKFQTVHLPIGPTLSPFSKAKKKKCLCCPLPTDRKMRKNRVGFFFFFFFYVRFGQRIC